MFFMFLIVCDFEIRTFVCKIHCLTQGLMRSLGIQAVQTNRVIKWLVIFNPWFVAYSKTNMYLLIKQSNCFTSLVWNWQIAFKPFFCVGWLTFYFFFTCNHDIYVKDLYKTFLWLGFFVFLIFKNGLESLPLKMLLFKIVYKQRFLHCLNNYLYLAFWNVAWGMQEYCWVYEN